MWECCIQPLYCDLGDYDWVHIISNVHILLPAFGSFRVFKFCLGMLIREYESIGKQNHRGFVGNPPLEKIIAPLEIIGLVMPADVNHVVFPGQRKLPHRFKNIIASSIHDSHWGNVERHLVTCLRTLHGHSS